jgi:hypothetical protein
MISGHETNPQNLTVMELKGLLLREVTNFIAAVEAGEDAEHLMQLKTRTTEIYALLRIKETNAGDSAPQEGDLTATA